MTDSDACQGEGEPLDAKCTEIAHPIAFAAATGSETGSGPPSRSIIEDKQLVGDAILVLAP